MTESSQEEDSQPPATSGEAETPAAAAAAPVSITFAEFLEGTPPSQMTPVTDLLELEFNGARKTWHLTAPDLQLHCASNVCNGPRIYRFKDGDREVGMDSGKFANTYLTYLCSNCRQSVKLFSVHAVISQPPPAGTCYKFGEYPPFGPPTPTRLLRLFGKDRDLFLRGRRCENQGLGIGAFVYYRRVVEAHKNQILDEIIRVSERVGAPKEQVDLLNDAKQETQFAKAIKSVRDAMPQALLLNGQNPLTLLHSALSAGLHEESDERCLELAQDIRVVLAELADRLTQALKDEAELSNAVKRLMQAKAT